MLSHRCLPTRFPGHLHLQFPGQALTAVTHSPLPELSAVSTPRHHRYMACELYPLEKKTHEQIPPFFLALLDHVESTMEGSFQLLLEKVMLLKFFFYP